MAPLRSARWLGVFLVLMLVDYAWHRKRADRSLSELPASGSVNLRQYLAPESFGLIERAFDRAILAGVPFELQLFRLLLERKDLCDGLRRLDVKPEEVSQKIEAALGAADTEAKAQERRTLALAGAEAIVVQALPSAVRRGHRDINPADLLVGLVAAGRENIQRITGAFTVDPGDLERALIFSEARRHFSSLRRLPAALGGISFEVHRGLRHRVINRAWTSRPTPNLDQYSLDFTDLARTGSIGLMIGHQEEYERLVSSLSRPVNPNALLIGDNGIGKETIVAHLAYAITRDDVPPALFDRRLVALQLSSLVAGAAPEELQRRIQVVANEILRAGNIVLCIPDIHNLLRTSGTAFLSAADAFLPIIKDNAFPIIGLTYAREFKEAIEPHSDFLGLFEIIRVQEISDAEAERVLVYQCLLLEHQTGITVSFGAIKQAVGLARKHLRQKLLPSSASELVKEAVVQAGQRGERMVGPERIMALVEQKTKVPIHAASQAEAEVLLNLEEVIHRQFIDQDEAVHAVANSLREYRSGLARKGGPIASFLFVGPTGVGKTELAKILAQIQFGAKTSMLRFDMTEFQDRAGLQRFLGAPEGASPGALTEAVLHQSYSLILLDEFEKAHPDILNIFLQVLDDGRLTDNLGRTVDFQNTIIIATSNAHSDLIVQAVAAGQPVAEIADTVKARLTDVFKPELLNRFSKIVVFENLSPENLSKVAVLALGELVQTVAEQGIKLEFDAAAIAKVVELGYDPLYGARPLRRAIEEHVRAPLAEKLLRREVVQGNQVTLTVRDGRLDFVVASESAG